MHAPHVDRVRPFNVAILIIDDDAGGCWKVELVDTLLIGPLIGFRVFV